MQIGCVATTSSRTIVIGVVILVIHVAMSCDMRCYGGDASIDVHMHRNNVCLSMTAVPTLHSVIPYEGPTKMVCHDNVSSI